uniref:tail completion protein gp17 n=1 Tax=Castellaniella defragrans TaxID=75697 RepID=UPI00333F5D88
MAVEAELFSLLKSLVDGRCYPDTTPDAPQFPCIVYQGVGGRAYDYLERKLPDSEHYRIQVNCWARSRADANALALQVRQRIIGDGVAFAAAETMGQAASLYEENLKLYGTRQDFGIWIRAR